MLPREGQRLSCLARSSGSSAPFEALGQSEYLDSNRRERTAKYSEHRIFRHFHRGAKMDRVAVAWSKRTALRTGYGAVIAVLVLSAVEAYRIQVSVSQQ